ncbi:MAG TPA: carbohydrate ABC transporter permease [Thermomicrobiales bacterium]|nr:carbohydrate ABC transporter permease [Thermomicrobiales bacterium]
MRSFFETGKTGAALYYVLNGLVGLIFFIPFYWTVTTSLKPTQNILISPPQLIPSPVTLENYRFMWFERPEVRGYFLNSALVSVGTVLAVVVIGTLAGYGFAKMRIPFKSLLFFAVLMGLMIPNQSLLIPLFDIFQRLELINTRLGLVLLYTTFQLPFAVFVMRNSFESIPSEILEAARIDGAHELRIWSSIAVPLALPGVVTIGILTLIFAWNEFLIALIFTTTDAMKTVPVGLAVLMGIYGTQWEMLTTVATMSFIPVILLFLLSQRAFMRAVSSGAVK